VIEINSSKAAEPQTSSQAMTAPLSRPDALVGSTYKLRWPESEHAFYVTINDIEAGGSRRPFEIFINSIMWNQSKSGIGGAITHLDK
jgi:ribonucleoside-diphosphate reductase alpha chain